MRLAHLNSSFRRCRPDRRPFGQAQDDLGRLHALNRAPTVCTDVSEYLDRQINALFGELLGGLPRARYRRNRSRCPLPLDRPNPIAARRPLADGAFGNPVSRRELSVGNRCRSKRAFDASPIYLPLLHPKYAPSSFFDREKIRRRYGGGKKGKQPAANIPLPSYQDRLASVAEAGDARRCHRDTRAG